MNVLDEQEKLPNENNSIGIILCKEKNNKIVEYAFKSIDKSMGVATYKTSRQLPAQFKKVLPNAEALKKLLLINERIKIHYAIIDRFQIELTSHSILSSLF